MDSLDLRVAVSNLVTVLRKITKIVKALPFIYLGFYAAYIALDLVSSDLLVSILDYFITVTPAVSAVLLVISKALNLCKWHKIACVIPFSSDISTFIDSTILQFTQNEIVIMDLILLIAVSTFSSLAHKNVAYGC